MAKWPITPPSVPDLSRITNLAQEIRDAASNIADYARGSSLRLGVSGLSRAGKTVFITSLIHNLQRGGRLPVLHAYAEGRLLSARLEQQPDDAVPSFAYGEHVAALTGGAAGPSARVWPQSTRQISQLRLTLEFERTSTWRKGRGEFTIDIVDYPGEWLLDLPLLEKSYDQWSRETLEAAAAAARASIAAPWRGYLATLEPAAPFDEMTARQAAELFTAYLRGAKAESFALSALTPGRFLMPGDLEGSPALTFSPLHSDEGATHPAGSLAALMERRYEAYKTHVVKPFFRDHFARLDRQIVLVDALGALNSGPAAVRDLETALSDVLSAFRIGRSNLLTQIFRPKIDRVLFAATKADHLHHTSHDALEAILRQLVARAITRTQSGGVDFDVIAMAAVRATREASVSHDGRNLEAIIGTPMAGERLGDELFDGSSEAAIFPGQLPDDPRAAFRGEGLGARDGETDYRFLRFRPPLTKSPDAPLPHIRLDRALQFLFGDKLA